LELGKVKFVYDVYVLTPFTSAQFIEMYPDFFEESKTIGTKTIYTTRLISWARFNNWVKSGFPNNQNENSDEVKISKKTKKNPRRKLVVGDNGVAARNQTFYNEWLKNYGLLVQFKMTNGNTDVPARYKFEGIALGTWVVRQRAVQDSLSQTKIDKLNELDFDWNPNETHWQNLYKELAEYYGLNGHSNIPVIFPENPPLGKWCFKQRQNYKSDILKPDKIKLLEDIEFVWFPQDINFEDNLKLVSDFFKKSGHFKIPSNKEFQQLNNWFNSQKRRCKKGTLSDEKKQRFKDIGYEINA
jgi:hypothetical protein